MKHKDKWYPFYTQKRGDTEKTFNHRLPKEIKSALDPLEGLQQNAQEIELMVETLQEINKQLEEHQKIADNENEDPVVRERAREKVRKDTERKAGFEREKNQLEQKREQLVERLPLREQARIRFKTLIERLKVLFKKHGFTIATVVTAVGTYSPRKQSLPKQAHQDPHALFNDWCGCQNTCRWRKCCCKWHKDSWQEGW